MGRRKLTDEQLEKAIAWREAGCSSQWIAEQLGGVVSSSALDWHFLKHGVESPNTAAGQHSANRLVGRNQPGSVVQRGNHVVRRFTPEEDRHLLQLAEQGVSNSEIGRRLVPPRKPNVVLGRLLTLARREARAEEAVGA